MFFTGLNFKKIFMIMILIFMKTWHWQGEASTTWCTEKLNENQGTPLVKECFSFSLILPIWSEVSSSLSPRRLLTHSFFFFFLKFNIYFYFELHWIINSCKILQRLAMYPSLSFYDKTIFYNNGPCWHNHQVRYRHSSTF